MGFLADLHLHSRYAYATSSSLNLDNLAYWAGLKGIDLLATADFTHPAWFAELKEALIPSSPGLYRYGGVQFVLGTEVSCIFRQGGRGRRVHMLLFAPSLETAAKINQALLPYGNLEADGRPALSLSLSDLTALVLAVNPDCLLVPAHAWTPWYGIFGSRSGFDCLEEAFGDLSGQIHAIETGLSSDPLMNWSVPELANKSIISFSDAHSLPRLARELTRFGGELSYPGLAEALRRNLVEYTIEFYPEEGKYHFDGHRRCRLRQHPATTRQAGEACPVCGSPLTLGVLNRVLQLAGSGPGTPAIGRGKGSESAVGGFIVSPDARPSFIRLIPLQEIIAGVRGRGVNSKGVQSDYFRIAAELGNEVEALLNASGADLEPVCGPELAQAVLKARHGQVLLEPGYDGVYGTVSFQ